MASNLLLYRCSLLAYQHGRAATAITGRAGRTVAIGSSGYGSRARNSIRLARNCYSSLNNNNAAFVIANDEKYGNKQNISLTPRLYDYILDNVREPEASTLWYMYNFFLAALGAL